MEVIKVEMKQKGLEMTADREQVAMALKTYRLRHGLTQQQLGERWGASRWTIMRIERAKSISWEMAYKVFARLSVDLAKEDKDLLTFKATE